MTIESATTPAEAIAPVQTYLAQSSPTLAIQVSTMRDGKLLFTLLDAGGTPVHRVCASPRLFEAIPAASLAAHFTTITLAKAIIQHGTRALELSTVRNIFGVTQLMLL